MRTRTSIFARLVFTKIWMLNAAIVMVEFPIILSSLSSSIIGSGFWLKNKPEMITRNPTIKAKGGYDAL